MVWLRRGYVEEHRLFLRQDVRARQEGEVFGEAQLHVEYVFVQAVLATELHAVRKVVDLLVALQSGEVLKTVHFWVPDEARFLGRLRLGQAVEVQHSLDDVDVVAELVEQLDSGPVWRSRERVEGVRGGSGGLLALRGPREPAQRRLCLFGLVEPVDLGKQAPAFLEALIRPGFRGGRTCLLVSHEDRFFGEALLGGALRRGFSASPELAQVFSDVPGAALFLLVQVFVGLGLAGIAACLCACPE